MGRAHCLHQRPHHSIRLPKRRMALAGLHMLSACAHPGWYAPRLLTRSALVMPTPESRMVSVLLVLSGCRWMNSSGSDSSTLLSVSDWKRT